MSIDHSEVTRLLRAWSDGDERALDSLMPLVYEDLHRAAHLYMAREAPHNTLQARALVNEVYLRLAGGRPTNWNDRSHFFAVCATVMRRILTDMARARRSLKRGGSADHLPLDDEILVSNSPRVDLLELDEALTSLAAVDQRQARVVELRFFGGLSGAGTAEAFHRFPRTGHPEWALVTGKVVHGIVP